MTNKELRLKIRALGEGRSLPPEPNIGLCWYLEENVKANYSQCRIIRGLMFTWPRFSGIRTYPVPHPTDDPDIAFNFKNKWEPKEARNGADRQYIENRLSMCRYIARKLFKMEDWK